MEVDSWHDQVPAFLSRRQFRGLNLVYPPLLKSYLIQSIRLSFAQGSELSVSSFVIHDIHMYLYLIYARPWPFSYVLPSFSCGSYSWLGNPLLILEALMRRNLVILHFRNSYCTACVVFSLKLSEPAWILWREKREKRWKVCLMRRCDAQKKRSYLVPLGELLEDMSKSHLIFSLFPRCVILFLAGSSIHGRWFLKSNWSLRNDTRCPLSLHPRRGETDGGFLE